MEESKGTSKIERDASGYGRTELDTFLYKDNTIQLHVVDSSYHCKEPSFLGICVQYT